MSNQLYKERSANDLPKKEGQYFVVMFNPRTNEEFPSTEQFKEGKWTFNNAIVRWLEPVESIQQGISLDLEQGFEDGDIVFAPKKKQDTQPSIFVYDSKIDYSNYYEGRFFRIKDSGSFEHHIDKVIEKLEDANPYQNSKNTFEDGAERGWEKCCDKLQELLNQSK